MKFNLVVLQAAYGQSSQEFHALGKLVHEEILFGMYLKRHGNKVLEAIASIADNHEGEMHRGALIGSLAERIPPLDLKDDKGKPLSDFDKAEAQAIAAGLLVQVFRTNGMFEYKTKGKMITKQNGKRFEIPQHVVMFDGLKEPKDVIKGLERHPGVVTQKRVGPFKLPGKLKRYLRRASSVPFKVSDIASEELLLKGYSLMQDYNTASRDETLYKKHKVRYPLYIKAIMEELTDMPEFYLQAWYDSRLRMYYNFGIPGMNPLGKLWETCMIDSAEPYYLDEVGVKHIKHIIYVLRHGRTTMADALRLFTQKDRNWARDQNPLGDDLVFKDGCSAAISHFGDRVLANKCHRALELYENGLPTYYLFGKDLTNSGLMVAGASFKSPQMMALANLGGLEAVMDSHDSYTKGFGITGLERSVIKKVGQEMLHGSTLKSVAEHINRLTPDDVKDITAEELAEVNHQVFGTSIDNIEKMAAWGAANIDNYQTRIPWKSPDGFLVYHEAKLKHLPFTVRVVTEENRKGYTEDTVVKTMPINFNAKGRPFVAAGYGAGVYSKSGVVVKVRGLYANITHHLDAYFLRKLIDWFEGDDAPFMMKHDNYFCRANDLDGVIEQGQLFFAELYRNNYYEHALVQIHRNTKGRMLGFPKVQLGEAKQTIKDSVNFMMP